MQFDGLPDPFPRRRKEDDRPDVPGKPAAEFGEIQISFMTPEDESLDVAAQRIQSPECCLGYGCDGVVVKGHAVKSSDEFQPMRQTAEDFDRILNRCRLDSTE